MKHSRSSIFTETILAESIICLVVNLGVTVIVATVGFPNIGLQGFAPKLAKGEIASLSGAGEDARYFQISVPVQPGS